MGVIIIRSTEPTAKYWADLEHKQMVEDSHYRLGVILCLMSFDSRLGPEIKNIFEPLWWQGLPIRLNPVCGDSYRY